MQRALRSSLVAGLLHEGLKPAFATHAADGLLRLLSAAQDRTGPAGRPGSTEAAGVSRPQRSWRGFAAQAELAEPPEEEQEDIEHVRARIFGNHIGNGERSGRKVLRRAQKGEMVASWYLNSPYDSNPAKLDPLFVDPDNERKKEKADKLRRRGKGPPKKGQGKRAVKGKRR